MTKQDKSKQVFDVSKPGKSAPSATSRPVITPRGPIVQDPTLKKPESENPNPTVPESETPSSPPVPTTSSKVIVPPSQTNDEPEASADDAVSTEPEATTDNAETSSPEDSASESSDASDSGLASDGVVDAVAEQAGLNKTQKQDDEDRARQEELEKMVADKTYHVAIKQSNARRLNQALLVIGLLFIALAIFAFILIDAGIIKTSFTLPVDLIKN